METVDKIKERLLINRELLEVIEWPLERTHVFGIEGGQVVYRPSEIYSTQATLRTEMTTPHREGYYVTLLARIKIYDTVVRRNRAINRHYETPILTPQEVEVFTTEAFERSFWKQRASYQTVFEELSYSKERTSST